MRKSISRFGLVAALSLSAGAALANDTPLRDQSGVSERLITAAIAYELGRVCDDVDVRLIRGLAYLNGIKSYARELGYSNSEIDAYVDDKVEKKRLEGIARERLAAMGATKDDEPSHCTVARAEMAAGTQIGLLLR